MLGSSASTPFTAAVSGGGILIIIVAGKIPSMQTFWYCRFHAKINFGNQVPCGRV